MEAIRFRKSARAKAKASIAIEGLSGKGKSGLALELAYYLANEKWEDIYVADTENRSIDLYANTKFSTGITLPNEVLSSVDLSELAAYKPSYYAAAREIAIKAGGMVMINDSLSHCWTYKGGVLDMVNAEKLADKYANQYAIWGRPHIATEKQLIMELVRHSDIHCISTIRVKEKQEIVQEDGKTKLKSLGEQQLIMPDFKYEPDLVLSMISPAHENGTPARVKVVKSRYRIFDVDQEYDMTKDIMLQLKRYLDEGIDPEVLKEAQRADIINELKVIFSKDPGQKDVWSVLLENEGLPKAKVTSLDLRVLKKLYGLLVAE